MKTEIRIHNNLSWNILKALHDLYVHGRTTAKISGDPYCRYLTDDVELLETKLGSKKVILARDGFYDFFKDAYLERFEHCVGFLTDVGVESDARRSYYEDDIRTLMFIAKNKTQIVGSLSTRKSFSNEFFGKGSKYLENKQSLEKAVCHILEISNFPDMEKKDNMWRFVVDCVKPSCIVLCENLNFLKMFWVAEDNNIKLWYVGGNNIKILDQIDQKEFDYPFYYSCDWDHAGLVIYSRIKAKLRLQGKDIVLLYPNNSNARLPVDSPHHYSKWQFDKKLSGLEAEIFSNKEIELIQELINRNEWIEEESNGLIEMLEIR